MGHCRGQLVRGTKEKKAEQGMYFTLDVQEKPWSGFTVSEE